VAKRPHRPILSVYGFTTIELMVTIGILVVLMGMVVIGFGVVGNHGKRSATKATLQTAVALLSELEAKGQLLQIKDIYGPAWQGGIPAPTESVSLDALRGSRPVRYCDNVVLATQAVMDKLRQLPTNRSVIEKLPAERLMNDALSSKPSDPVVRLAPEAGKFRVTAGILVDAWGNPIVFVPAGGMNNVRLKATGNQDQTITSAGVFPTQNNPPPRAGARAFWASAGPDGRFDQGDDNLYSFEN